jgi:hypothetical protein
MKTKATLLVIGIFLLNSCVQQEEEPEFPEISEEFEIQGLTWRSIAYYYDSGIYQSLYNPEDNLRLITKARNAGANYLMVRAFYNCTGEGGLIGNDVEAEMQLRGAISDAHKNGIKIFLTPFVESMEFWPDRGCNLSSEEWTRTVLKWAQFAEENGVELFAPGFEMAIIMDNGDSREFFREMPPKIRKIYSGRITFAEIPYGEQWEFLDGEGVFHGYDCVGITVFPWEDYEGVHDLRGFDDLRNHIEVKAEVLNSIGERYNTSCRLVATLGMDDWYGKEPDAPVLSHGYNLSLDIFKKHNITGVFLHLWASEHDQLGDREEVEEMLSRRWTENAR